MFEISVFFLRCGPCVCVCSCSYTREVPSSARVCVCVCVCVRVRFFGGRKEKEEAKKVARSRAGKTSGRRSKEAKKKRVWNNKVKI